MLDTKQERERFCKEFNISDERFRNARLTWEELEEIADDFNLKRNEHQNTVKQYAEIIRKCSYVHSLSYRVKMTTHLIEKIIRKNAGYLKEGDSISKGNYEEKLTDLIGIRILLLFNDNIFEYCLIDILVDIARLKHFHDISRVNYIKFIAYTASWCLKRKPFQLIEGCDEKYIYVNERFALTILLQASGCYDENFDYSAEDQQELINTIKQMIYHLKYRNTNPQTLELLLIGMNAGKKIHIAV